MKKTSQLLLAAVAAFGLGSISALAQTSSTASPYAGNGAGGFGGPLGGSALTVSENSAAGTISFSLKTGNGGGFNNIAFYFDSVAGAGLANTSTLTDTGDAGRRTITGNSTTTSRSLVNFASGFAADYAVALDANGNANLFSLTPPNDQNGNPQAGIITFVSGANYTNPSAGVYGFTINESAIGLTPGTASTFAFVATLLNANDGNNGGVYRSNETIGDSNGNTSGNLGQNTLTYTDFDTFTTVPEPATYVAGALAALFGGVQLARRRRA